VWGEEFADFFARYCVHSLLEPGNIPLLAREHDATLLLYTDRATQQLLERCDSFRSLSGFAKVELLLLEQFPAMARTNHWIPWQHAVAGRNRDFDLFLIVIPDCVYAAGCLGAIVDALKEHDAVYYTLPQVCRETVATELDGLRRVDGHEYISFTALQAVELFIRHVNPKHAAAARSCTFFVNHPEYAIQLSAGSMVLSETGSHPFAVRSSTRSTSYTLDALSPGASTCYLEILGVSAEPMLKLMEEYYRWPKLYRDHSRLMNLGSWAWNFRDASNVAYSRSAIRIALDQGHAREQHREQVKHAKTKFINATLDCLAAATRIYERACEFPDAAAAKYVALAIAAPGFHRHLRGLQSGFTVVLPKTKSRFTEVVKRIECRPDAKQILRRFVFLHVVAHRLRIVPGHAIFLTYADAADDFPKAFVIDPHTVALGAGVWGKILSPPRWVWDSVFCVEADIDYSCLTWSMLDPVDGTSECVLAYSKSTDTMGDAHRRGNGMARADSSDGVPSAPRSTCPDVGRALARRTRSHIAIARAANVALAARSVADFLVVKARDLAPKLALMGRSAWLGRSLYRRRSPAAPQLSVATPVAPTESTRDGYDAISKLNVVENVAKITRAFYERLGLDPQQSPVYRCLASVRSKLAEEVETRGAIPAALSSLECFELAWRAYEANRVQVALQLFREVIADEQLAEASATDPRAREAFVRAAEIVGRHAELRGDTNAAAQLYRRVLELDGNGIIARRLLLMLWRENRIREAAELAPRVLGSDGNLAQHLRGGGAVNDLARRLGREARLFAPSMEDDRHLQARLA
jgi:hypothetical protein